MAYADVEKLLVGWAPGALAGGLGITVRVATEVPAQLAEALPLVQFSRFGGGDDSPTLDRAHVDADVFAATRAAAHDLAEAVRMLLRFDLPGRSIGGAVVAAVQTMTGPAERPWADSGLYRFGASYVLTVHSA